MTVYLDSLFLLNAALDYLLLLGAARLAGLPARRWRSLGAAALGALYAAGCVVPELAVLRALPCKIFSFAAMVLLAAGAGRSAIRLGVVFLALSFAFGGLVFVLAEVFGTGLTLLNGAAYYPVSAGALVLTAAAVYFLSRTVLARLVQHAGGGLVEVELRMGGRSARLTALRDTGNTLRDPATNEGVLVADWHIAKALLPAPACEGLDGAAFAQPAELLPRLARAEPAGKWRLIPYRAVGSEGAMLLAMRCDAVRVEKKTVRGGLVAFSPNAVSDGGGYMALLGGA